MWIFSAIVILLGIYLMAFVTAKSDAVAGKGFSVPAWPFVIVIGFLSNPLIVQAFVTIYTAKAKATIAAHEEDKKLSAPPTDANP